MDGGLIPSTAGDQLTVRVGIPVSLTGQFSLQGAQTLFGIRAWAEDTNRYGGLAVGAGRRLVELVWHDDRSRPDHVVAVTRRLIIDDAVDVLVGPYSAVLANAAAQVAREHGRLLWNQGGASPLIYQSGNPWVVGILTPADEYLAGLLPAVRGVSPGARTVAILRASTGAFPKDVASGVEQAADELGFLSVLSEQFDASAIDHEELVRAVRDAAPDVLVVAGRFQNDLAIARVLAESAPAIGAVAVVAAGVDAFRERLGAMADNFIGPSQWEPQAGHAVDFGPSTAEVLASLKGAGHSVIDYPTAQAYAVGVVIQRCLEECGSLNETALRQAAASQDFTTFYGRFRIDSSTGHPIGRSPLLVQWQQGRKVVVWPPESSTGLLAHPWRQS